MNESTKKLIKYLFLKKGSKVRVKRGMFRGMTGTVRFIRGKYIFIDLDIPLQVSSHIQILGKEFLLDEIEVLI
ncbi:MAG: hypothetical protein DRN81_07005 [Thermoproteota archaeon]|nr:MAG: hypothetical protein DRN81_07005 [Candidatus Korarchaeota archaeon]